MPKSFLFVVLLASVSCGGSGSPASTSPSANVPVATITVAQNAKLGQILVDGNGRTLYLFEADTSSASTCYGSCATYWPPLLTGGPPQAGAGANASLLGTTKRNDGTTEVTYAGHPLYYFIADKKPGDVTGQDINAFGGPWYVVSPSGMQIA